MKNAHLETLGYLPSYAKGTDGWGKAHLLAITSPKSGVERALVEMLTGWLRYADAIAATSDSGIGNDYVLGPCWAQIGSGMRGLLNGDLGRMDGGTLDSALCRALEKEGFDPDTL